ncbi:MAG: hypothetical protein Q4Q07_07210 [Tissierellia bacterium]|nr:hypothetical protein [Tissierellia bacterium]
MAKRKRIRLDGSNGKPKTQVSTQNPGKSSESFTIDLSFQGLYYSIAEDNFFNYLKNESNFIENFKKLRKLIVDLRNKNFLRELINDPGMRHCHIIDPQKEELVKKCIKKSLNKYYEEISCTHDLETIISQTIGNEKLYQLGYEGTLRIIGTYNEVRGIFKVFLIDYHHRVNYDQRRNNIDPRHYKYCPMTK